MKIELKNIKHSQFASEETNCFEATIYIDGVKACRVRNTGQGGPNDFEDREVEKRLNEYGKTLPKKTSNIDVGDARMHALHEYDQDAETIVGDLLTDYLMRRDMKKALNKKVLFTVAGKKGVFETKAVKAEVKAAWLADVPKYFKDADKILNLLPEADAFALYKTEGAK